MTTDLIAAVLVGVIVLTFATVSIRRTLADRRRRKHRADLDEIAARSQLYPLGNVKRQETRDKGW